MTRVSRLVTLSTDIGPIYSAQVKGVLLRSIPAGSVVELTSELPRHNIAEGAFLVRQMARFFPAGSVHLVVVDPGVGGQRAPVAVECKDGSLLVGPDNGILYPLAEALGISVAVRLARHYLAADSRISPTFEGRDLFAPAAVRLAMGDSIHDLGSQHSLTPFPIPEPRRTARAIEGIVLHVDHFGNIITNVPSGWLPSGKQGASVAFGSRRPTPLSRVKVYEELPRDRVGLLTSSFGLLEVAIRERSAAARLRVSVGEGLRLRWTDSVKSAPARK